MTKSYKYISEYLDHLIDIEHPSDCENIFEDLPREKGTSVKISHVASKWDGHFLINAFKIHIRGKSARYCATLHSDGGVIFTRTLMHRKFSSLSRWLGSKKNAEWDIHAAGLNLE